MSTLVSEYAASRVWFEGEYLVVQLSDGAAFRAPLALYPRLAHASESARQNLELVRRGTAVHWPDLDEDLTVEGIARGVPDRTNFARRHREHCRRCADLRDSSGLWERASESHAVQQGSPRDGSGSDGSGHSRPTARAKSASPKKVVDVEGVGVVFAEKLIAAGIRTTDDLLRIGATPAGRKELAAATGIDARKILEWVNRADLLRVRGVGPEYSELLESASVNTVKELAARRPDTLYAKLLEVNAASKLVRRPPSRTAVEGWVAAAKSLPPAVIH